MDESYKIVYEFEKKFILHPSGEVTVYELSELEYIRQSLEQEKLETQQKIDDISSDISNTKNPTMFGKILTALHLRK